MKDMKGMKDLGLEGWVEERCWGMRGGDEVEGFGGPVAQLVECPFRKGRNNEITGGTGIEARQVQVLNCKEVLKETF